MVDAILSRIGSHFERAELGQITPRQFYIFINEEFDLLVRDAAKPQPPSEPFISKPGCRYGFPHQEYDSGVIARAVLHRYFLVYHALDKVSLNKLIKKYPDSKELFEYLFVKLMAIHEDRKQISLASSLSRAQQEVEDLKEQIRDSEKRAEELRKQQPPVV